MRENGFTLIELIIIILIISILAIIAIPKFISLSYKATVASERQVMVELQGVINTDHMQNIVNGTDQYYQSDNPFELMAVTPQGWTMVPLYDFVYIKCPHMTSNDGIDDNRHGAVFVYRRRKTYNDYPTLPLGKVKLYKDYHGDTYHGSDLDLDQWTGNQ